MNQPAAGVLESIRKQQQTPHTHTEPDENNQERFDEITFQPLGTRVGWYET